MVRSPFCEKMGLRKGPWTAEEDRILVSYIERHGHGNWRVLTKQAGLQRCGKSCRLRWLNYLRPDIKRGNFAAEEEETIIATHAVLGNRWSAIAAKLPGRTDNEIKNVWHTYLKKRAHPTAADPARKDPKRSRIGGDGDAVPATEPAALQFNNASAGFTISLQSSASETSTPSVTGENNNEGCGGGGFPELPELDGRFFKSEASPSMETPVSWTEPFWSMAVPSAEMPGSLLLHEDDMDFWSKMLAGAGELPHLPTGSAPSSTE